MKYQRITECDRFLFEKIEKLYRTLFPGRETSLTFSRIQRLLASDNFILFGGYIGDDLKMVSTIVIMETISRTAAIYEELISDPKIRGMGYGKGMDQFVINYVKEYTTATRIEGTVNENNMVAWNMHLSQGFFDRKNKTILMVINR